MKAIQTPRLYYAPFHPTKLKQSIGDSCTHPTLTYFRHRTLPKPISCKVQSHQPSFTISYLIDSCGLSPDTAALTSQKLHLSSSERPDSVLTLLREQGFSNSQISNIVRKRPLLLLSNPNEILWPKLQFFLSIGFSNSDLARTLTADPTLLTRSLEKQIIPSYNFLKSVLLSDEKVVASLKRTSWVFLEDHNKNLVPNLNVLRELGVPESCVTLLLTHFPEALMQKKENFAKLSGEIKEMGFDPKKTTFVLAIHVLSGEGNKSIYNRCYEVYQRWGWSSDDILLAFKKHPHCMILSEDKIMKTMDYLVNKMGWPSGMIARCPVVLFFSLEKRIKPRCSVVQVLLLKGLIKKTLSLTTLLLPEENRFLEKFVIKYEQHVPQLWSVYQRKMDFKSVIWVYRIGQIATICILFFLKFYIIHKSPLAFFWHPVVSECLVCNVNGMCLESKRMKNEEQQYDIWTWFSIQSSHMLYVTDISYYHYLQEDILINWSCYFKNSSIMFLRLNLQQWMKM